MSDPKTINIEVEVEEDYQEGMNALTEIIALNKHIVTNNHLYTKEEILEALADFTTLIDMVFIAGQAVIETQLLIQEVEGPKQ